ncbi:MAG TPA: alpha-1,4-glucan--maltose-1-phosphate maltosyltransferase [Xanthobacteraceae bacterium]|nr:alpha-1,4-glucan--maltose-1-phosphate maltosyltransferase [Xanthobacteraceae bacterium]
MASISGLAAKRYFIEDIYPSIDCGRFPVKRIAGEPVDVWADIVRDGHEVSAATLRWRELDGAWNSMPLRHHSNDRWGGRFTPPHPGSYVYQIEVWTDEFATWRRDFLLKRKANQAGPLEAIEGAALLTAATPTDADAEALIARHRDEFLRTGDSETLLSDELAAVMSIHAPRHDLTHSPALPLMVERERARTGAWYEMVARSQGTVAGRHGTFDDAIARLPDIAGMGFDVIYLPPIHPIGRINRKGRNNALQAEPDDPGSMYAIGSPEGGHDAIHPELGTLEDFRRFVAACREHGMEVALDYAVQCSPDHPWLASHPEWFKRRPDGSIRYAENPPKKYEDIVNPDFYGTNAETLWPALRDVVLFWAGEGVRIFRVDNPHTKPFPFWEWLIREVKRAYPEAIFLSEAFTRPKVMKALAKLGFSQSYTYFTWRTGKDELQTYLTEITGYPEREYFRPNFFTNTPDILPFHLQGGEAWMFKARLALAATLAASYGIYNGFELLEHEPIPGREEYLNSEKYEIRVRDWNAPGNIKDYIGWINRTRRAHPALLQTANLRFVPVDDPQVIGFVKESTDHSSAVAVAIALAKEPRQLWFHFGDLQIGPETARRHVVAVENLATGERHAVEWGGVRLHIDPQRDPALLLRCLVQP